MSQDAAAVGLIRIPTLPFFVFRGKNPGVCPGRYRDSSVPGGDGYRGRTGQEKGEFMKRRNMTEQVAAAGAEMELAQAFYTTNAARAAFYPHITLSGTLGWTNNGGGIITNPGQWLLNVALDTLTIAIKITLTELKNKNRI